MGNVDIFVRFGDVWLLKEDYLEQLAVNMPNGASFIVNFDEDYPKHLIQLAISTEGVTFLDAAFTDIFVGTPATIQFYPHNTDTVFVPYVLPQSMIGVVLLYVQQHSCDYAAYVHPKGWAISLEHIDNPVALFPNKHIKLA